MQQCEINIGRKQYRRQMCEVHVEVIFTHVPLLVSPLPLSCQAIHCSISTTDKDSFADHVSYHTTQHCFGSLPKRACNGCQNLPAAFPAVKHLSHIRYCGCEQVRSPNILYMKYIHMHVSSDVPSTYQTTVEQLIKPNAKIQVRQGCLCQLDPSCIKVKGCRQPKGAWFARQLFLCKLLLFVSRARSRVQT